MGAKINRQILLSIMAFGFVSFASVADVAPAMNTEKVEMEKLNGQLEKILEKTEDLNDFQMVEINI